MKEGKEKSMGITYFEKERIFKLDTKNTSYLIGITDEENFIGHIYYGKKLEDHNLAYLLRTEESPYVPSVNVRDRVSFLIPSRWNIRDTEQATIGKPLSG